jgi:hypothetical protein
MTPHEWLAVYAAGTAATAAAAWWWGRTHPSARAVAEAADDACQDDHDRLADYWYEEGWDDACAEATGKTTEAAALTTSPMAPVSGVVLPAMNVIGQGAIYGSGPGLYPSSDLGPLRGADWTEQIRHDLDPQALDAEAERLHNLPGPLGAEQPEAGRGANPQPGRAGELHYDSPLPAVLMLGAEGDGTNRTAARVQLRGMDMLSRFEQEQAEFCRRSGIEWRGLVVAA